MGTETELIDLKDKMEAVKDFLLASNIYDYTLHVDGEYVLVRWFFTTTTTLPIRQVRMEIKL